MMTLLESFLKMFKDNFLTPFPKFFIYDFILPPQMTVFAPFSLKMSYFDVFDPFNTTLGQYWAPKIDHEPKNLSHDLY